MSAGSHLRRCAGWLVTVRSPADFPVMAVPEVVPVVVVDATMRLIPGVLGNFLVRSGALLAIAALP